MTINRHIIFWIVAAIVTLWLLATLQEILLPFVVGLIIAYLLNPAVCWFSSIGVGRTWSAILFIVVFIVLILLLLSILLPPLVQQIVNFAEQLPTYIERIRAQLASMEFSWLTALIGIDIDTDSLQEQFQSIAGEVSDGLTGAMGGMKTLIGRIYAGSQAILNVLTLIVLSPIIAAYLLIDWNKFTETVEHNLPRAHREVILSLWQQINDTVAGFVRGQMSVGLCLGAFYSLCLLLIGLPFGLLIGLLAGLFSFIPFVGSIGGFLLSIIVAFGSFWGEPLPPVLVAITFLVGQVLEGYILTPKLVGERVGLHPVWLMFSLFSFGYLFGFVGLLIAVPIAASIGVLVRFAFVQYRASSIYLGEEEASHPHDLGA